MGACIIEHVPLVLDSSIGTRESPDVMGYGWTMVEDR